MLNRIKQFVTAVTADITAEDRHLVRRYLSEDERQLFWNMNTPEQRHSLNVAYTVQELAADRGVDAGLLIRAALLHDIGKVRGDISIPDKVITVLADLFCPQIAKRWAKEGKGGRMKNFRHALYIYYNHAARGAAMLQARGKEQDLIRLVRDHHLPPAADDSAELALLREADDLN